MAARAGDGQITAPQRMLSACSGALATSLLMTPLDVVKTRLQAQAGGTKPAACPFLFDGQSTGTGAARARSFATAAECARCCAAPAQPCLHPPLLTSALSPWWCPRALLLHWWCRCSHFYNLNNGLMEHTIVSRRAANIACDLHFSGTIDAFRKIVRHEGMLSLYNGLPPTLVMAVPSTILYFTTYDTIKIGLQDQLLPAWAQPIAPPLAGSLARLLAATAVTPLELVRTQMMAERGEDANRIVLKRLRKEVARDGVRVLYRGLAPTLARYGRANRWHL
eukprot:SAG31_NODE_6473_length_2004_cov_1.867192_1_plen_279_part_00